MPWGVEETSLPHKIRFGPIESGRFVWLSDTYGEFDPDTDEDRLSMELTAPALDVENGEPFTDSGEWTFRYGICRESAKNKFEIVEYDPDDENEVNGIVIESPRGKNFNSMTGAGRFVTALMESIPADELQNWGMPEEIKTYLGKELILEGTDFEFNGQEYTLHLPIGLAEEGTQAQLAVDEEEEEKPNPAKAAAAKAKLKKVKPEEEKPKKPTTLKAAVVAIAKKHTDEEEFYAQLFDPAAFKGAEKLMENDALMEELPAIFEEHKKQG